MNRSGRNGRTTTARKRRRQRSWCDLLLLRLCPFLLISPSGAQAKSASYWEGEKHDSDVKVQKLQKKLDEERERYALLSSQFSELNAKMVEIINNVTHLQYDEVEQVPFALPRSPSSSSLRLTPPTGEGGQASAAAQEGASPERPVRRCLLWLLAAQRAQHPHQALVTAPASPRVVSCHKYVRSPSFYPGTSTYLKCLLYFIENTWVYQWGAFFQAVVLVSPWALFLVGKEATLSSPTGVACASPSTRNRCKDHLPSYSSKQRKK